jgi:hypothetical protein
LNGPETTQYADEKSKHSKGPYIGNIKLRNNFQREDKRTEQVGKGCWQLGTGHYLQPPLRNRFHFERKWCSSALRDADL